MKIKSNNYYIFIFSLFIFLYSFLIRSFLVTQLNYGLEQDEIEWGSIYALQNNGSDPLELGVWSRQVASAKIYPTSQFLIYFFQIILGENIYSARLALAFSLSISAAVFFILLNQFLSLRVSIFTAILFTFSSYRVSLGLVAEQPGFIELPLLLTILFLVLSSKFKSNRFGFANLFVFFSSCFSIATMMTYNQSYYLPILQLSAACAFLFFNKISIKKSLVFAVSATIPYLVFGSRLIQNLQHELEAGKYALGNSAISVSGTTLIDLGLLSNNLSIYLTNLFVGLRYSTSDMIISHSQTIIPYLITGLAAAGLLFCFIFYKKYYLFIGLSILMVVTHGVLGLNLARMWVGSVVTIFILAGFGAGLIEKFIMTISNKYLFTKKLFWGRFVSLITVTLAVAVIITEVKIVINESIFNTAYSTRIESIYNHFRLNQLVGNSRYIYKVDDHEIDDLTTLFQLAKIENDSLNYNGLINQHILVNKEETK